VDHNQYSHDAGQEIVLEHIENILSGKIEHCDQNEANALTNIPIQSSHCFIPVAFQTVNWPACVTNPNALWPYKGHKPAPATFAKVECRPVAKVIRL